mgnify:CR=1 FL=1
MQIVYIPSESMSVQGKKDEIYKRYGKDWNIREQGGGNGNWLLTRKSDVLVDGKSYRTFVLEHYGKSKLTAKLVDKFREDVANGKINCKCLCRYAMSIVHSITASLSLS